MNEHHPAVIPAADERKSVQFGVASVDPDGPPPTGPDPESWTEVYRLTDEEAAEVMSAYHDVMEELARAKPGEWHRSNRRIETQDVAAAVSELVSMTPPGYSALFVRRLSDEHAKDAA